MGGNIYKHQWNDFVNAQKQIDKSLYKIRQLSITEQTRLLIKAIEQKQEREVLEYLLKVESVNFSSSKRELSKNLVSKLIDIFINYDRLSKNSIDLLLALVRYFPKYEKKIQTKMIKYLDEADNNEDYEVYQRVGLFLNKVESPYFMTFLSRCSNHNSSDINSVVELWNSEKN